MIVIAGCIIVIAATLIGFIGSGGHVEALIHPFELVTIGGCALGAMVIMSSKKMLIDLVKGMMQTIKGSPFNKKMYMDLFTVMYDLFRTARREGLLALEAHISDPHESEIFKRAPTISHNHHVTDFMSGALASLIDGSVKPDQLASMLELEIKVMEEEHHAPLGVLTKTADGLPGFGIVAAVLGIVITMAHIDGPVEEIGHKVGAALVGTFLGILASYGFIGPLATRMEFLGLAELMFFRTMSNGIMAFAGDLPPKVAIEQARRGISSEFRPTREEVEDLFRTVDSS